MSRQPPRAEADSQRSRPHFLQGRGSVGRRPPVAAAQRLRGALKRANNPLLALSINEFSSDVR